MTKEEVKDALYWAKEHEKCDQRCKLNGGFQRIQCFAYQALLFVHKTSAEALKIYADGTKWKVSEPMKSLGWTPGDIARKALDDIGARE